jgi:prevent-host-death family protein
MAHVTVGIRELKAQLSKYVKQVKAGETVVITERGKPIGRIVPTEPSLEARLKELEQAGLVA